VDVLHYLVRVGEVDTLIRERDIAARGMDELKVCRTPDPARDLLRDIQPIDLVNVRADGERKLRVARTNF
jgi:hypothetical protein